MIRRIKKFIALSLKDKILLLKTYVLLSMIRTFLYFFPFKSLRKFLNNSGSRKSVRSPVGKEKILWAIAVTRKYVPQNTCLVQALACDYLLKKNNHDSRLTIGVSREGTDFQAHAWIESEGEVVLGKIEDMEKYIPLPSIDRVLQ